MDLAEAEDIKKRWQEYTEELYKKTGLNDPDNHSGVITHTQLEPDFLECEVKWALGNITRNKASRGYLILCLILTVILSLIFFFTLHNSLEIQPSCCMYP